MYFPKMNNSIFASPCVCILLLLLKNVFDDWNLILALNILHILQLRFKGLITEISKRTVFNYWFISYIFFQVCRFRSWYSVKHIYIMPRRELKCSVSKFTNFNIFYRFFFQVLFYVEHTVEQFFSTWMLKVWNYIRFLFENSHPIPFVYFSWSLVNLQKCTF